MRLKDVLNVEIGGVDFDIVKNKYYDYSEKAIYNNNGRGLSDCYIKCSIAKKKIFDEWKTWFISNLNTCCCFGVQSYNCMIFTLGCKYADINKNISGIISITPCNNTLSVRNEVYNKLKNEVYKVKKDFAQVLSKYASYNHKSLHIIIKDEIDYLLTKYYMRLPKEIIINVCRALVDEL